MEAARGCEALDLAAPRVSLQRHVERCAGILDGAADQRLHGLIAAAGIDELDVQAFCREVTAGAGDLVGHDAEELAAEREPHLFGRAVHDRAGEGCGTARRADLRD
jgi:hypothetical protein